MMESNHKRIRLRKKRPWDLEEIERQRKEFENKVKEKLPFFFINEYNINRYEDFISYRYTICIYNKIVYISILFSRKRGTNYSVFEWGDPIFEWSDKLESYFYYTKSSKEREFSCADEAIEYASSHVKEILQNAYKKCEDYKKIFDEMGNAYGISLEPEA